MKKLALGIALLSTLLSGCESMSPAECATANWHERGVEDGSQGRRDSAADYYESCAKAGLRVDVSSYRAGRADGLQSYCRLDNAIHEGQAGHRYQDVCPLPAGQNFKRVHAVAYREQEARQTLARLQSEQDRWQTELRDTKTDPKRKADLREQLARSDRRVTDARDDLREAQYQLDRLRSELRRQRPD